MGEILQFKGLFLLRTALVVLLPDIWAVILEENLRDLCKLPLVSDELAAVPEDFLDLFCHKTSNSIIHLGTFLMFLGISREFVC